MALTRVTVLALLLILASGCAGTTPGRDASRSGSGSEAAGRNSSADKTVRIAVRYEIDNLATKVIGPNGPTITRRFFNASQALIDDKGDARPYLAEQLPQLNTDTWRVFPDGRMETTYTLRPNLTWHDGQPLTSDDFVFAYRLYTTPGLGFFTPDPQDTVEEVVAIDARTFVIRWSSLYFDAGSLREDHLDPLPKHILERGLNTFQQDPATRDSFVNMSFWTQEYVGAGPYRLTQWVPGSQIEGVAFEGHALGKPKIGRIIVRVFNDENTTLTNMLSGNLDVTVNLALRYEHGQVLRNEWESRGAGKVLSAPGSNSASVVQFRPEYQKTRGLHDLRVRKAVAHAIDKQAVNEGVFDGQGFPVDTFMSPLMPYFQQLDRTIAKYPYDPRRTSELMAEAGYTRGADGIFVSSGGERFKPDFWVTAGAQYERHQAIIIEGWKRAGIDSEPWAIPLAAGRVNEVRATFPGLTQIGGGSTEDSVMKNFLSNQIGSAANAWRGSNRGGWSNNEFDGIWDVYSVTLEPRERVSQIIALNKILSEDIPGYPLYANINVRAQSSALVAQLDEVVITSPSWNVHEWEFR
jgi:peptide/nickel transport system substrate-binding protein